MIRIQKRLAAIGNRRMMAPLLALVLLTALSPAEAAADFRVCNRTAEEVFVAVAYQSGSSHVTRGWYKAAPGRCVTPVTGTLQQRYYYVFADGPNGAWRGDAGFCINADSAFTYLGKRACDRGSQRMESFDRVDTGMSLDFTLNLNPAVSAETVHAAIDDIRVRWRSSALENYVLRLYNDQYGAVSFSLRCYTRSGVSQTFSVTIPGRSYREIGFLEGWTGNFVRGESCEAYHGEERVWKVNALDGRG